MTGARFMRALAEGWGAVRRNPGLAAFLLAVNIGVAAVLAVPFAITVERSLKNKGAGESMMYGFDYPWWSQFSGTSKGEASEFGPDIFGHGFAFKNISFLLRGDLPAGAFRSKSGGDDEEETRNLDGTILALGVAYLVLQVFLSGGIYATLRRPRAQWTMRALLHGAGFYFGRFARISLVALLLDYLLFKLNVPFARFADRMAQEAVSEKTALYWLFGSHALLLLAILAVHLVSGYAKAITVLEERSSALLAWASAASFCARSSGRVASHYGAIALLGVLLLVVWRFLDSRWEVTGYKTQIVAFALMQALVFGRLALRVALASGQLALYRDRGEV